MIRKHHAPESKGRPASDSRTTIPGSTDIAVKTFVIDTSVLLHNPSAIFVFEENNVVIPFAVLEEIDKFKSVSNDVGRNARQCIRYLDMLRNRGRLIEGVQLSDGIEPASNNPDRRPNDPPSGSLRIDAVDHERPAAIRADTNDNRIIASALALKEKGEHVVFVSKDINARIKADALEITAEDFENQKVDVDHLYQGYATLRVDGEKIDQLYSEKMLPLDELHEVLTHTDAAGTSYTQEIEPNQLDRKSVV